MKRCLECGGVVPQQSSHCPNCVVTARAGGTRWLKAAAFTTLLVSGCTAVPVYGIACTEKLLDGGDHGCPGDCDLILDDGGVRANEPGSGCLLPDGGTP